jgi:hypothetical protein
MLFQITGKVAEGSLCVDCIDTVLKDQKTVFQLIQLFHCEGASMRIGVIFKISLNLLCILPNLLERQLVSHKIVNSSVQKQLEIDLA